MRKQSGVSLWGLITTLAVLGFAAIMAAKLLPSYLEFFAVKKIIAAMEAAGEFKGTVREIRYTFDKRNAIEDVKGMKGEDLEVTKDGAETVVTATWSVRIPMVYNINACLDFYVTTAK
jgi:Domain of unknown function (DUF4845)